jgi:hypothetical protein
MERLRGPDGGQRRRPHDHQACRRDVHREVGWRSVADDDGVTDLPVQLGERRGAQDDLVVRFDRVPGQYRRGDLRVRAGQDDRRGLAVDLGVGERHAAPCCHQPVVPQQR